MLALYRSGRQADALEAYQRGRRLLADELGLEPGETLRRLETRILQQDPELDRPSVPPGAAVTPARRSARSRRWPVVAVAAALLGIAAIAGLLIAATTGHRPATAECCLVTHRARRRRSAESHRHVTDGRRGARRGREPRFPDEDPLRRLRPERLPAEDRGGGADIGPRGRRRDAEPEGAVQAHAAVSRDAFPRARLRLRQECVLRRAAKRDGVSSSPTARTATSAVTSPVS